MKKRSTWIAVLTAAVLATACTPSNISSEESLGTAPDGAQISTETHSTMSIKDKPTVQYSIPADAPTGVNGGPGMMETTAVDDSYYPEDKRNTEENAGSVICIYDVDGTGVTQSMAEVSEVSAESVIAAMVENGVLAESTTVEGFTQDGETASITLSELTAVYTKAKTEQILACVGNSLIENLNLESIDITAGGTDYGTQVYTDEYNAT